MYRNILVATDGSKLSLKAVTHAIDLAKVLGSRLTGFFASPSYPLPVYADGVVFTPLSRREYAAQCKEEADRILGAVATKAKAAGVEFTAASAISASPWEAILAAARKHKCDAIVMASHGRRGVSALVLGSETNKVLTHSKLPVLVVR
ncbi:MAG TPA: universal stress protein [Casimicrobiaceae bacterium]|nr:universal stress protein [Casimicrobiaceae bacterium]